MRIARATTAGAIALATITMAACSTDADEGPDTSADPTPASAEPTPTESADLTGQTVTVVTHDSFAVPDEVLAAFEDETGLTVEFAAPGDAGALVNQLILTKDAPIGDVVYGVDTTFASRAIDEGVFADYTSTAPAAADAAQYAIAGSSALTAIDYSDVCLNYDIAWFEESGLDVPQSIGALSDPQYNGLLSVTNPATSSPGLAFLLATVAELGDDWTSYWEALRENQVRVTASWSDTYFVDFSVPNYGGDYPLVLSYASSPPSEVIDGEPTSAALLDTCFRQVEYAGVLEGAENPAAGQAVVDWMLSDEFQANLPDNMYVYPVSSSVDVPEAWAEFAPLADDPITMDPAQISANRDDYIAEWTSIVID
ncbi:thiamine ABC transporter substrate binding subunit [Demequina sp. NBRC 110053]|uniref:thiamine ABC transporter substrate-binding protein n=1 Tax=Demequina sp. NBRC 110053 TaxID=1570342 RepID=UPI000A071E6A|nr:thiamine ABC transporter substrate-binding protein [Demequina sp. NBRC 110053]